MEKLSKKNTLLIGVTLFSMFFGAGNLIFPPFLGAQAGTQTITALIGFCITAIGFPVLGVVVVAKSGGLTSLANRVNPIFSAIFTMLIYLSIGPMLAIPRTSSTSFEIAVTPFLSGSQNILTLRVIYSALFFALAFIIALRPDKLTDRLGKIMTPCLLILIATVFIGSFFYPNPITPPPAEIYSKIPIVQGFLDGYQTMDTIAALNFGIIIAINIRAKGLNDDKGIVMQTIKAGFIAGAMLLAVYCSLAYVGAIGNIANATNGTDVLKGVVYNLFGKTGLIILAAIFVIACFNTCVGLICCCSKYFNSIFPKVSYRSWAIFFAVISMIISNVGLNTILSLSIPILNAIYPIAIVLIILGICHNYIENLRYVYQSSILFTGIISVGFALGIEKWSIPVISQLFYKLPLYTIGLGWIIPAIVGLILGIILSFIFPRRYMA